ncbi:MAG: hypothetical protein RL071_3326 [Pseudomonadota bacterium]|jgi:hypothetical protein
MAIAFASFDEPHAWLLRGLVEYGWADWSRLRGQLPPGSFGGIDLGPWTEGDGRDGIPLVVPAQVQGQRCVDDGTYSFTVQVQRRQGGLAVVVRCPEANFFQEFPYDPYNPLWAAGYVHQALLTYVPQYVSWRLAGGELGWAEREGVPRIQGEPASAGLISFVRGRVQANLPLELLAAEAWAIGRPGQVGSAGVPLPRITGAAPRSPAAPAPQQMGITAGSGSAEPLYLSAAAREALARGEQRPGLPQNDAVQARARTRKPANALMVVAGMTGLQSIFWLIDSLTIVAYYRDSLGSLLFALPLFLILLPASVAAAWGAWQLREVKGGPMPWVAMGVAALSPGCCLFGLPVAIWAGRAWMDPMVVAVRSPRTGGPAPAAPGPIGPGISAGGAAPAARGIQGPIAQARPRNAVERAVDKLQSLTKKLPF